jgi:Domain of unknown function (DUF4440)
VGTISIIAETEELKNFFATISAMRKQGLVAVVLVCLTSVGCSMWGKRAPGFAGATGGEQLQRAFLDEIKNKHWTEVEQRLSANFVLVTPGGVFDRAAAMERIRNLDLKSYTLSDLVVRPQGADAVLTYLISVDATMNGSALPSEAQRVVSTWQEVSGHWILISQVNVGK